MNVVAFSVYLFLRDVQAIIVRKGHYGCLLYFISRQLATLYRLTDDQRARVSTEITDSSESISPAAPEFFKIRPDPRRVGSNIAHAHARNRTHVQTASVRYRHNAYDHIVLEPEPEGSGRCFDMALGWIGVHDHPSPVPRRGKCSLKGLCRRHRQHERNDVGISPMLLFSDFWSSIFK